MTKARDDKTRAGVGPMADTAPASPAALDRTFTASGFPATERADAPREVDGSRPPRRRDQLDRFIVLDHLGQGGMGMVVSAYDPKLDRRVAIKLLKTTSANAAFVEHAKARLLREAQAMAKLRHPNVVAVYDVGTVGESVYVAMEYVDGGTLRSWLDETAPPVGADSGRWQAVVDQYLQAARGLEAAHAAGIIHRDFKPENVLVDREGRPQVTDFGLAGLLDSDEPIPDDSVMPSDPPTSLTRTGAVMGTPRYMAPEQHRGEATDERTDQFALCVALWEALYGETPFAGDTLAALAREVLDGRIREPRHPAGVPRRVREALERGLSADPDDRFESIRELREAIAPEPRRSRGLGFAAVGVVAAGAAVAAVLATRDDPPESGPSPEEVRANAAAAARDCNCALFTFELPEGAEVRAIRPLPGPREPIDLGRRRQATGQIAVPRGHYVVEYGAPGAVSWFGFISEGFGVDPTLALPPIREVEGYAFVAGGAALVAPDTAVELAPYLIARTETRRDANAGFREPDLFNARDALLYAERHRARLPTAVEWEWAAIIGAADGMLDKGRFEWTGTRFDDHRDLAQLDDDAREVRGGCRRPACELKPSTRQRGLAGGGAQLRLARDGDPRGTRIGPALRVATPPDPDIEGRWILSDADARRLDAFAEHLRRRDDSTYVALSNRQSCTAAQTRLTAAGVSGIFFAAGEDQSACEVQLHTGDPVERDLSERGRIVLTSTHVEILRPVAFEGAAPTPESGPTLDAVATTLKGNTDIKKMAIVVTTPRGADRSLYQERARRVRDHLVAAGVEPARMTLDYRNVPAAGEVPCRVNEADRDGERAREELMRGPLECDGDFVKPPEVAPVTFVIVERATTE